MRPVAACALGSASKLISTAFGHDATVTEALPVAYAVLMKLTLPVDLVVALDVRDLDTSSPPSLPCPARALHS